MAGPQKRKRRALKVLAQKAAQAQKKVVAPKAAVAPAVKSVEAPAPKRRVRRAAKVKSDD